MNLNKIISQGESETVEFKKSLSESKEIVETISAFANTKGTYSTRAPYFVFLNP
jgi:predicted HTH transcriptional regulator